MVFSGIATFVILKVIDLVIGLRAFDGGAALAKRLVVRFGLESLVRRLRRG